MSQVPGATKVLVALDMKMSVKDDWITVLYNFLAALQPGGAVVTRVLRTVLVLGLLRRVRQRFLDKLPLALNMSVAAPTATDKNRTRFDEKVANGRSVGALKSAYNRLDSAVLASNPKRIKAAQAAIIKAQQKLQDTLSGKQAASMMSKRRSAQARAAAYLQREGEYALGAVTGGLFRRRAMMVLHALTSPQLVVAPIVTAQGTTLAIGNLSILRSDALSTPSATELLHGHPGKARKRPLWEHLEFGVGVQAKRRPDGQGSRTRWLYGWEDNNGVARGFYLDGTQPMSFLFTDVTSLPIRPDDPAAAQAVLNQVMADLAPLPDAAYTA